MSNPIAGPSITSHKMTSSNSKPKNDQSDESDDDFMPELPPEFKASDKPVGPIGPSLPPGFNRSYEDTKDDEESEEDDGVAGPMPLPSYLVQNHDETEGVRALREREERQAEQDRIERDSKVLKREEWMLVPPKELDLPASIDPTKIKSRGFKQTSKPHSGTVERQGGTGSLWTETPAERAQRLEDEAMGKRRRAEDVAKGMGDDEDGNLDSLKRRKRDQEMRKQVEEHNKSIRSSSLLDLHNKASSNISKSKSKAEKEKDKKEAVVWDHDSMMGLGGKLMGEKQKADMIRDAKGLGGRFGGGSFL